jgi:hypothetical protein
MRDSNKLQNLFVISLIATTGVCAQDLKIECHGVVTHASSIGGSNEWKVEVYDFKKGKLYGWVPVLWSEKQIEVKFPIQKSNLANVEKFSRTIIIDRDSGSVMDYTKMWRSDIPVVENLPNSVSHFDGQCRKHFKNF